MPPAQEQGWEFCVSPPNTSCRPTNRSADSHQAHATSWALWFEPKTQQWVRQTDLWPLGVHGPREEEADAGGKTAEEAQGTKTRFQKDRDQCGQNSEDRNAVHSLCAGQLVALGRTVLT